MRYLLLFLFLIPFLMGQGCKKKPSEPSTSQLTMTATEPDRIQVQHILIGFSGTLPGKKIARSSEEAKKLASEILEKAKNGASFDDLVKQYTDDRAPGIYAMSNFNVKNEGEEFPRDQMVPAFGNVGFGLKVGGIGLASFDEATSPFGFHIIKRLK